MNARTQIRTDLSNSQAKWFAVYSKYKCEKLVAEKLKKKGIEVYVPLITETKQYVRKVKTYHKPLFNCYLFVKVVASEYVKVLETDHVMHFVKINRELISIPEKEIALLKRIVGECEDLELEQNYYEGMDVELIGGNLTGLSGVLLETKNKKNFVVQLEHIGFQLKMEINPAHIRPVHKHRLAKI